MRAGLDDLPAPAPGVRPVHPAAGLAALVVLAAASGACGDNFPGEGGPIERADTLFIVAHLDDDMIFMQPELVNALTRGSSATIYIASGDPVIGNQRARFVFEAAMLAYEQVVGQSNWECGYLTVHGTPVHHCRLPDRGVSMIGLDVADGGRYGERTESLTHLLEGKVSTMPVLGPIGGRVTVASLIDEIAALITAIDPVELHTLDISADHGDDHDGHLMTASFALWGAARAGYKGLLTSHRGYNVGREPPTLSEADFALAKPMLAYFEACYFKTCPCGTECPTLEKTHEALLRRQYAATSWPALTARLESAGAPGSCLVPRSDGMALADCADPGVLRLDADRHIRSGDLCATSAPGNDEPLALVPCSDDPAQYWLADDTGFIANGQPPRSEPDMTFDHVRCLMATAASASAPVCGHRQLARWQLRP